MIEGVFKNSLFPSERKHNMELRKARPEDLPEIAKIYDSARAALNAQGVDQWQDGYPNESSAREDICAGRGYVLVENGAVAATACLDFGHEPTYDKVYGGQWKGTGEYGFLHRVAVLPVCKGKGAAGLFFGELKRLAKERGVTVLRGDTHRDNLPMQRTMAKNGFEPRGTILLEDGSQRIAFECLL